MIRHTVNFRAIPSDAAECAWRSCILFAEPEANREHLVETFGQSMADRVLGMMEQGFIRGAYKEFNLLPGEQEGSWVLFLGFGKRDAHTRLHRRHDRLRGLMAIAARHFRRKGVTRFVVGDLGRFGIEAHRAGTLIAEGALLGTYNFDVYKSNTKWSVQTEEVLVATDAVDAMQGGLDLGRITGEAVSIARDLINTPSSDLRPLDFVAAARAIAHDFDTLRLEVLDRSEMEAEGMGLHLGVARGSNAPPAVAILRYIPKGQTDDGHWPLCLVGKGVTFDSGGLDIKSSAGMRRMSRDMAGAGAVLGAMHAIAASSVQCKVAALMPLSENMVNGEAFRPGDILRSRKGLTVEIANTDAEGRLLLADSLAYACDIFKPRTMVNIATLTGAVRVALGLFVTGLCTHSEDDAVDAGLADLFTDVGRFTGEWVWRLPVDDDYKVQLGSKVADLANCNLDGKTGAGVITAATFLKQFVDFDVVQRWGHLDIAATAFMERTAIYNRSPYMPREGATAVGVRMLAEMARRIADEEAAESAS